MHHDTAEMTESAAHMTTDPVCGMKVDTGACGPSFEHGGETYWFCSAGCRTKFAADPERYLTKKGEAKPLPKGTLYTCPMHPEIVQEGPGHCPICGMALEPMGVPPEITDNPELIDFTRRLTVAVPLSLDGVDSAILDPRSTWADGAAYDAQAKKLVSMFVTNFTKFEDHVDSKVRDAAPGLLLAAE